jgi:hypothetical protein
MLFKSDEQDSTAEEAYDNAFEEAVGGGFGAIRLVTEYEDEEDDENEKQRIRIEPIYDADSSVFFDLDAKRQDKADAKYCYVMYSMTSEEYEDEFGKSPVSMAKQVNYSEYDWYSPDLVYVAEYYLVEYKKETVRVFQTLTGDEERYTEEDFESNPDLEEQLDAVGTIEVRQKKVKKRRVHKYIIDGGSILEDCGIIAGKNLPIIPVYGKRWFVDSVERQMGHVRLIKDTQRIKNMLMSKLAEISSLSTVEKPILLPEQISQHEMMWAEDNITDYPYLLINPIENADGTTQAAGPVAYTKTPNIPPALAALMQIADIDMKEILGGTGEPDKIVSHVSGEAQSLVQKRIDGQAYIYMSNFAKAIKRIGEVWLSMAKDVYVEKGRNMKTIDTMGQIGTVKLNTLGIGQNSKAGEVNSLTEASFDVNVTVGPASQSQREATVKSVMGMLQLTQDPQTATILQSLALMNMEGDGIDDVRDYFRKNLVKMGAIKPTEEEKQMLQQMAANQKPDPNEVALQAMAQEAMAGAKKKEAEVFETLAKTEQIKADTLNTLDEIDLKKLHESRAYIEQVERIQQQKQQLALQQQAQMAQQQQAQMAKNPTGNGGNNQMQ